VRNLYEKHGEQVFLEWRRAGRKGRIMAGK